MKFSQAARCLNDPRGLVSFSPKRHRRQVRAISLNQETIEWKLARNLTQVLRVFESQIAGKRNVETEVNCVAGHLQTAAEAVHDTARFIAGEFLPKDVDRICVGFARMNHDRQIARLRQPQLSSKDFALYLARRMIVMIIKPDFSPGDYAFALFNQIEKQFFSRVVEKFCVVRMNADRNVDFVVIFSQLNRPFKGSAVRVARPDVEHGRNPGSARSRNDILAISVVFRTVDVAMGIDEGHRQD